MRIVVEVDDSAAEGASGIEYTSERLVSLPDGRHPVLGAAFLRRPVKRP
jgi:hypothetical protein